MIKNYKLYSEVYGFKIIQGEINF